MADSKTKIAPPPRKKAIPPPAEPSLNLNKEHSSELVQLKAYVSEEFRREFKHFAVDHNLSAGELIEKIFRFYTQSPK